MIHGNIGNSLRFVTLCTDLLAEEPGGQAGAEQVRVGQGRLKRRSLWGAVSRWGRRTLPLMEESETVRRG